MTEEIVWSPRLGARLEASRLRPASAASSSPPSSASARRRSACGRRAPSSPRRTGWPPDRGPLAGDLGVVGARPTPPLGSPAAGPTAPQRAPGTWPHPGRGRQDPRCPAGHLRRVGDGAVDARGLSSSATWPTSSGSPSATWPPCATPFVVDTRVAAVRPVRRRPPPGAATQPAGLAEASASRRARSWPGSSATARRRPRSSPGWPRCCRSIPRRSPPPCRAAVASTTLGELILSPPARARAAFGRPGPPHRHDRGHHQSLGATDGVDRCRRTSSAGRGR